METIKIESIKNRNYNQEINYIKQNQERDDMQPPDAKVQGNKLKK